VEEGAIKGKNNVKMCYGKQFLKSAGDCNYVLRYRTRGLVVLWDIGGLPTELVNKMKMTAKNINSDHSMELVYFIRFLLMPKQLWRSCIMEQNW
jgi:hypothetical protein